MSGRASLIIFDFDGTLCNTRPYLLGALNQIAASYGFKPFTNEEELQSLLDLGRKQAKERLGIGVFKEIRILRKLRAMMALQIEKAEIDTVLVDQVSRLYAAGCCLSIVSTNSEANIRSVLNRHGISNQFSICRGNVSMLAKASELRRLRRFFGPPQPLTCYIGDEVRDVAAAQDADMLSIGVTWGYQSAGVIKRSNPDAFVTNPSDLSDTVLRLTATNTNGMVQGGR